jgi:hypothetical protein
VIQHSYMHCWRHKTPLICLTARWFVGMDPVADKQSERNQYPARGVRWRPSSKLLRSGAGAGAFGMIARRQVVHVSRVSATGACDPVLPAQSVGWSCTRAPPADGTCSACRTSRASKPGWTVDAASGSCSVTETRRLR